MKDIINKIKNVDFEITYLCNLRCLHCYNSHHNKQQELTLEQIKDIIFQVKEAGFKEIHINGGEPLTRDDAYDILSYSSQIGLNVILETNALLLDKISDKLKNIENFSIRASIDGPEDFHNIIRRNIDGKNPFKTSVSNLSDAKRLGIDVQITCSVNRINYNKIYDMVKQLTQYHLDDIRLRLCMPAGYSDYHWSILKLYKSEFLEIKNQVSRISEEFPKIRFDSESIKRNIPSIEPKFFIDPYGNVKPYPFIEYYIGDLKIENVSEIINRMDSIQLPEKEEEKMTNYLSEIGII